MIALLQGNGWSGLNITRNHQVFLVKNAITGNGTQTGSTGGRFGVVRESSSNPVPADIQLLTNLICGNRLGEISGPALDATAATSRRPAPRGPASRPAPAATMPPRSTGSWPALTGFSAPRTPKRAS